jgi:L-ascorbate metabolism protein UlaG (beta-lactamase superfamily)
MGCPEHCNNRPVIDVNRNNDICCDSMAAVTSSNRMDRIRRSPQFRDGAFRNLSVTPIQTREFSILKVLRNQLSPPPGKNPVKPLPVVHTDLRADTHRPTVVWFGHSSYYIQLNGKRILVDPVFSGNAAPVSFIGRSFPGTDYYSTDHFPVLDAVLITHDHYDHLDHKTVLKLESKTLHFYTSLGVGAHLERWGVPSDRITELDWWEEASLGGLELVAAPARHFSGRSFKRNTTLWSSFILKGGGFNLYLGGDSGYDTHFQHIGEKYGPFDLALLECGQYNAMWPLIHMMPEETAQAALDLKARRLMPVHWGKFSLALHQWKEPVIRVSEAAQRLEVSVTTPRIGEPVILGQSYPDSRWWESV